MAQAKGKTRKRPTNDDYPEDALFFTQRQCYLGAELLRKGRLDPGSVWTISLIRTEEPTGQRGQTRSIRVSSVVRMSDTLTLTRKSGNGRRNATFSYLCYSAIWTMKSK